MEAWDIENQLVKFRSCKCTTKALTAFMLTSSKVDERGIFRMIVNATVLKFNVIQKRVGPGVYFVELKQIDD